MARGPEDPAQTNGQLLETARMAPRGAKQITMSAGSAKGWGLLKIDTVAAFLESDPIRRKIWSIPSMEATFPSDKILVAKKAIYGLADRAGDSLRTLDNFIRNDSAWESKAGCKISPSMLHPRLCYVKKII